MSPFKIREVLDATGAVLVRGDPQRVVSGVSTDTRTLAAGQAFLALQGPSFDGNRFARAAAERGASLLVLRGLPGQALPDLPIEAAIALHPDPRRALCDLATWHRSRLGAIVVGVTGSCGKTTTKNILAELLSTRMPTVSSPASFNNDIGVPLTLLAADAETGALVVEMGTNAPGEIAHLARIARPFGGVITNVGASHLEGLGSEEGVAREKRELFAALPREGFAVLNLDCRFQRILSEAIACRTITVSVEGEGDLDALNPTFQSGTTTFELDGVQITSPLLGIHNVHNLLCALAVVRGLGLDVRDFFPAIGRLKGGRQRLERRVLGEWDVIDDSYNANPESCRAALRVLAGLHGHRRRVLVLGDMLELGPRGPELHHQLGAAVAGTSIDLLILVGDLSQATAAGALEARMDPARVRHFADTELAASEIGALLEAGDVVLFKASRRVGLERVIQKLSELAPARST